MTLLDIDNLKKSFRAGLFGGARKEVVRGVSMRVDEGEVVGLLGRNGAGKTTTFRMIAGLLKPDSGAVAFRGQDVTRLPMHLRARSGIGYLPQESSVFLRLTVRENILAVLDGTAAAGRRLARSERDDRAQAVLREMGIEPLADRRADSGLSGGERRRVEIARALALDPKLLLFDEPFTGLDPIVIDDLTQVILSLREKRGLSVFLIDHNVRDTLRAASRIYLMFEGEIRLQGAPAEIIDNPVAKKYYLGDHFEA
jgi:lipopolysaccharide export system ATP-binding protein